MEVSYDERRLTELLLHIAERLLPTRPVARRSSTRCCTSPTSPTFSGDAEISTEDFLGYSVYRLVPNRVADMSVFSEVELASIDKVIDDLEGLAARQVGDLSHEDAGWRLVEFGDTIPYETALVDSAQISTPTSRRLERNAASQHGLLPASLTASSSAQQSSRRRTRVRRGQNR